MSGLLSHVRHLGKIGAYSVIGASAYPVLAAKVLSRQLRRSSIPPAPDSPLPLTDRWGTGVAATLWAFAPDLAVYLAELDPKRSRLAYDYPRAFESHTVEVAEGVRLACRVAAQRDASARPTMIFIPGMFATVTQNVVVQLARRAHEDWGYNVVVADMRDFGETARLSAVPSGMGGHEGEDVVALARWARARFGSVRLSVMGFSFGGAVALSAALKGKGVIDACIAFCPPLDARALILHFSQPVRGASSFSLFQVFYQWLLLRSSEVRGRGDVEHFHDYVSKVCAPYYGAEEDALYDAGSVHVRIAELSVPTLIIHADDDPVVPYQHSLALRDAALLHENHLLQVVISKGGGHYGHWAVMPRWTDRTIRTFLSRLELPQHVFAEPA